MPFWRLGHLTTLRKGARPFGFSISAEGGNGKASLRRPATQGLKGEDCPLKGPPSATPCYAGTKKDEGLRGFSYYVKERSRPIYG
jgi:hypothetical protein